MSISDPCDLVIGGSREGGSGTKIPYFHADFWENWPIYEGGATRLGLTHPVCEILDPSLIRRNFHCLIAFIFSVITVQKVESKF